MKLLETILREGTGSDQKLPCSEIKRAGWNSQERRLLTQGWRDGEMEKALTLEEASEREMETMEGEAISSQDKDKETVQFCFS